MRLKRVHQCNLQHREIASMSHPIVRVFQRIIGTIVLCIGLVGLFIPFVPIWMLIIPGIALLGRNDPLIRSLHLTALRLIKSVKQHKSPWIRTIGRMTYDAYRRMRRMTSQMLTRFTEHTRDVTRSPKS
jgi:hypothetical protein